MYIFLLVLGGGQDKPAWTACPLGVKITRVGGKISRDSLPPGGKLSRGQDKLGHRQKEHSFSLVHRSESHQCFHFVFVIFILLLFHMYPLNMFVQQF